MSSSLEWKKLVELVLPHKIYQNGALNPFSIPREKNFDM